MERIETVVVGAGVVGLAIARELSRSGRNVVVIERETTFGTGTSSRNSEVIHAGLYYPPGSLKARLCVEGAALLYAFCAERDVPHRRCGKLIVACEPAQCSSLMEIAERAAACGAEGVQWLEGQDARALEPQLHAEAALLSVNTGIVDSHALMQSLLGDTEDHGGALAVASEVVGVEVDASGFDLRVVANGVESRLKARELINSAGLSAARLASRIFGLPKESVPTLYWAKGNYFTLGRRAPFSHLVYPLPDRAGLGVHLTLDLAGQARFGPDVEWISSVDYRVDPSRAAMFERQVRQYWPRLPAGALSPGYAGIRPKLAGPGEAAADFRVDGVLRHGIPGLVNLFGIESPGLTASLALARLVRKELDQAR